MKRYIPFLVAFILSMQGRAQQADDDQRVKVIPSKFFSGDTAASAGKKLWGSFGIGTFRTWGNVEGFNLSKGLVWEDDSKIRKLKIALSMDLNIFESSPSEQYYNTSFLIGHQYSKYRLKVYGAIGPGIMAGVKQGSLVSSSNGWFSEDTYEKEFFLTPCLSVEAGVYLVPIKFLGVGLMGFSENGFYRSNYGFNLSVIVGDVW